MKEDRSRFHGSRQHAPTQPVVYGAAARAARMRSAWMSAEAEFELETTVTSWKALPASLH